MEVEHDIGYGWRVRDFLLMLKAGREVFRFEVKAGRNEQTKYDPFLAKEDIDQAALEEAICCVEAVYKGIEPKVGRKPDIRLPASFVRNRLNVQINFYSQRRHGAWKCYDGKPCGENVEECRKSGCKLKGLEDEYCNMIREAIRCVEVTGTGVPEPPTISLEDLRCQADRRIQYTESGEGNQEYRN